MFSSLVDGHAALNSALLAQIVKHREAERGVVADGVPRQLAVRRGPEHDPVAATDEAVEDREAERGQRAIATLDQAATLVTFRRALHGEVSGVSENLVARVREADGRETVQTRDVLDRLSVAARPVTKCARAKTPG